MTQNETTSGALHVCPWWLIRVFDNPIRRIFQDPCSILKGVLFSGDVCLDLGCGIGYFTIPMATFVGPTGSITAADLQPEMLNGVLKRAKKSNLETRINIHQVDSSGLNFTGVFDFALAFWMLHEVPDKRLTLSQIQRALKPSGRFLFVEPKAHVPRAAFEQSVQLAQEIGFAVTSEVNVSISRGVLFSNHVESAV